MLAFIRRSLCALVLGLPAAGAAAEYWDSPRLGKGTVLNTLRSRHDASGCVGERLAIGMVIRSGTLVDAIGLECAALGPNGEHQNLSQGTLVGNAHGGNARTLRCPSGQVVTAMRARAGEFIDQVSFACRSWSATQGLHGSLRWQPAQGGTGGEPAGPVECPSDKALLTLWVKVSGSYIGDIRMKCRDLPPAQPTTATPDTSTRPASSSSTSRAVSIPRGIQPATNAPQPVAPILNTLSSKPATRGSFEITIDGAHFAANQVTHVEIAGTSVPYRIVSPTRIAATVPQHVYTKLDKRRVPIVVTSGGKRVSKQLPLR